MTAWAAHRAPTEATRTVTLSTVTACGCILGLAGLLQGWLETNTDVSWGLTLGERWLGGERPYVDFVEVNPPATLWLAMPAVLAARATGVSPEAATIVLTLLAALASTAATCRELVRTGLVSRERRGVFFAGVLALLTLLPTGDFAEREHLATMATLPLLAVLAGRLAGTVPNLPFGLVAGIAAGLALAVKPMFGLALVGPVMLVAARRCWRTPFRAPELYPAVLVPALYGAAIPWLYPAFTATILHQVLVAYVPVRQPLVVLLLSPVTLVGSGLATLALLVRRPGTARAWCDVLLLGALGFAAAFLLQGKAWAYQGLPAVSLAAIAAMSGWLGYRSTGLTLRSSLEVLTFAGLASAGAIAFAGHATMGATIPGLEEAIAAAKPHPTMLALTSDIAVGHPLVRDLGGHWVGSYPAEWITGNANKLRVAGTSAAVDAELDRFGHEERARVVADLARAKPDVVLVYGPRWQRYVDDDADLRAQMAAYQQGGTYGPVTLWTRRIDGKGAGP